MAVGADIVAYLDTATSLTAGTDLFEGPLPELPDACVAITPTGGEGGEYTMGASLSAPGLEMTRFQLAVRNAVQATAISNANSYHALLANLGPTTLSGRLYHHVEPIDGEPYTIGQDDLMRWRYVANYRAWKARG
jgi:hypothetical protein